MADDVKELRRRANYVRERLKDIKSEQEKLKAEMAGLRQKLGQGEGQKGGKAKKDV